MDIRRLARSFAFVVGFFVVVGLPATLIAYLIIHNYWLIGLLLFLGLLAIVIYVLEGHMENG